MSEQGRLDVRITGDSSDLQREISRLRREVDTLGRSLGRVFSPLEGGLDSRTTAALLKQEALYKRINKSLEQRLQLQRRITLGEQTTRAASRSAPGTGGANEAVGPSSRDRNVAARNISEFWKEYERRYVMGANSFSQRVGETRGSIQSQLERAFGQSPSDRSRLAGRSIGEFWRDFENQYVLGANSFSQRVGMSRAQLQRQLEQTFAPSGAQSIYHSLSNRSFNWTQYFREQSQQLQQASGRYARLLGTTNKNLQTMYDQLFGAQNPIAASRLSRLAQLRNNQRMSVSRGASIEERQERLALMISTQRLRVTEAMKREQNGVVGSLVVQERRLDDLLSRQRRLNEEVKKEERARRSTASATARQSANTSRTAVRDPLSPEFADDVWATRRNILFGDGGANLMALNAALYAQYAILGKLFQAWSYLTGFVLQLDQEFAQLQAITGTTNNSMKELENTLIQVSQQTKFTALEVTQAATVLGQAGFSTGQIKRAIEDVTLLATAVGTDLKTAVDLATSVIGIFNLTADNMGTVANVITEAVNNTKLSMDKLTLGVQYAANIAAQSNVNFQELTAIMGAMANAGIRSGSTMGTGLRQLLIDLQTPTENFKDKLNSLGLTMESINVRSQGLSGVLSNLAEAGFTSADAFDVFEVRAAAAFSAISNQIDTIVNLRQQFEITNAAAEANAIQLESLSNKLSIFVSNVGTTFKAAFDPFLEMLKDIVDGVNNFLQQLNLAPQRLQAFGTILAGLGLAVTGKLLLALVSGFGRMAGVTITASGSLAALTQTVRMHGVAIGVAGIAVKGFLGTVGLLTVAMKSLFPFALLTAAGALAVHLVGLRNETEKLTDELDRAKTATNNARQAYDSQSDVIQTLDDDIARLVERSASLRENTDEARIAALEARETYGQYGLTLREDLAGDIDYVIERHRDLINTLREGQPELLAARINALGQQREIETELLMTSRQQAREFIPGAVNTIRRFQDPGSRRFDGPSSIVNSEEANQIVEVLEQIQTNLSSAAPVNTDLMVPLSLQISGLLEEVRNAPRSQFQNRDFLIETLSGTISQLDNVMESVERIQQTDLHLGFARREQEINNRLSLLNDNRRSQTGRSFEEEFNLLNDRFNNTKGSFPDITGNAEFRFDTVSQLLDPQLEAMNEFLEVIESYEDEADRVALSGIAQRLRATINSVQEEVDKEKERFIDSQVSAIETSIAVVDSQIASATQELEAANRQQNEAQAVDLNDRLNLMIRTRASLQRDLARANTGVDPRVEDLDSTGLDASALGLLRAEESQISTEMTADLERLSNNELQSLLERRNQSVQGLVRQLTRENETLNGVIEESFNIDLIRKVGTQRIENIDRSFAEQSALLLGHIEALNALGDNAESQNIQQQLDELMQDWSDSREQAEEVTANALFRATSFMIENLIPQIEARLANARQQMGDSLSLDRLAEAYNDVFSSFKASIDAQITLIREDPSLSDTEQKAAIERLLNEADVALARYNEERVTRANSIILEQLNYDQDQLTAELERLRSSDVNDSVQTVRANQQRAMDLQEEIMINRVEQFMREHKALALQNPDEFRRRVDALKAEMARTGANIVRYFEDIITEMNSNVMDLIASRRSEEAALVTARLRSEGRTPNSEEMEILRTNQDILRGKDIAELSRQYGISDDPGIGVTGDVEGFNEALRIRDELRELNFNDLLEGFEDVGSSSGGASDAVDELAQAMERSSRAVEAAEHRFNDTMFYAGMPLRQFEAEAAAYDAPQNQGALGESGQMVLEDRRFQLETEEMLARAVALRALAAELSPEIEEVSRAVQIYEDRVSRATVGTSEYAEAQRDLWSAQDRLAELERRRAEAMADATVTQSEATARTSEATSQINSMGDAVEAAIERWRRMSGANKGFYEQISDAIVDSMEAANRSFGTFVRDVASGTKSIGESFRDMATSIIQSLLEIAAQRAATAIFDDILGMVGIGGGGSSGGGRRSSNQTGGGGIGGLISGGFNFLSGLFNDGGYIRANQGRYIPTRDSVPVLARPGEYILRNSAVEAIGRDNLDTINAMGNRVISGSSQSIQSPLGNQSGEGGVVNVWIVSPDEKPQLGPRDIIAVVNDEIARNGSTKRLIQSIRT